MIRVKDFWDYLAGKNFIFFSGVPCSIFKTVLDEAINSEIITYVPAVREDVAMGVSSGAYLAGKKSGILIQNSGLGHIVNTLTSFNLIYKIPVLMFISWRGYMGKDAPEHKIMGRKTISLLSGLDIPHRALSVDFDKDLNWAIGIMEKKHIPVALIVKEGLFK
ncbi:MAG: hypothetical protein Q8L26_02335 [Candidatus Omnitrophota bacterium]|nr:hypothetical protein [Candidatus Omnitrophota bacterium]